MEKVGKYMLTAVATIAGLFVIFFGIVTIMATLELVTWDQVWEWSAKVGVVAVVVLATNLLVASLACAVPHNNCAPAKSKSTSKKK